MEWWNHLATMSLNSWIKFVLCVINQSINQSMCECVLLVQKCRGLFTNLVHCISKIRAWISNYSMLVQLIYVNTLRPRQDGRHFPDDIFKWNFLNENAWISIEISLTFVPRGPINNIPALVQIMAWRRPGDKPLSEPIMIVLPTHICVTRPQWVKKAPGRRWRA